MQKGVDFVWSFPATMEVQAKLQLPKNLIRKILQLLLFAETGLFFCVAYRHNFGLVTFVYGYSNYKIQILLCQPFLEIFLTKILTMKKGARPTNR